MRATVGILLSTAVLVLSLSAAPCPQPMPAALEKLPLGSVRPEGWLRTQLELQRDGLTGHAEELYEDIGESDWLTGGKKGGQYAWERGPYYAKGLVALALTLDDAALKAKAERWVTSIIRSQRENGDFGPKDDNWWANMIALHLVRDWGAATDDKRVEPFLRRYFAYQLKRLPEHPLSADSCWAEARVGDELEVLLWLYDRHPEQPLADLARMLVNQAADWTGYYTRGGEGEYGSKGFRQHIVNFMQGLKLPALKWRIRGDAADRGAYRAAFGADGWVMKMHGRIDRMVNGSEPLAGRSASEGTELCAIAERILSCQDVVASIGDLAAADDLETVAYNTLPSALGDDGRGMRYYQLLNQPVCETKRDLGFVNNHEGTCYTPGPDAGYGCCRSNFHFAWPKFVQAMWMRKDGGLAAVAYGPSTLRTTVGGREIVVKTETDYPFGDTVTLRIEQGGGTFPIFARIPGWDAAKDAGAFRKFERNWQAGDEIKLVFSPKVETEKGIHDSIAVKRGALVYSLKIDAETTALAAPTNRTGFPIREIRPKTPWNYALVVPASGLAARFVPAGDLTGNVFAQGRVPCALKVRGFRTISGCWGSMRPWIPARPNEPPPSPIVRTAEDGPDEELTFVPMGATQIRMTLFPWATAGKSGANAAVACPPAVRTADLAPYSTNRLGYALNNGLGMTAGGRLWASWIAGEDGAGAFTVANYSDDGGESWSDVALVIDGHGDKATDRTNIIGTFWLDPNGGFRLYTDQSSGHFDGRAGFWESVCADPDAPVTKWSPMRRLGHGHLLNKPIVLASGHWAMSGYLNWARWGAAKGAFAELDGERSATCYVSSDGGTTWEKRGTAIFPGKDWQESQLVELKDGTLRVFSRVKDGNVGKLMAADSKDEGRTWTKVFSLTSMDNPNTRFQIVRLKSGRLLFVKQGAPSAGGKDGQGRDRLTAYLSEDDGKTWLGGLQLFAGASSYPDVCQGPDGVIYVSHDHERSAKAEIWLHRFCEEDVLARRIVSRRGRLGLLVSRGMGKKSSADAATPVVRRGGVEGRPYWNAHSIMFMYPPAFGFAKVDGAVKCRFDVLDDVRETLSFVADSPEADLSPVWPKLRVGYATVTVTGVGADGRDLGIAGRRTYAPGVHVSGVGTTLRGNRLHDAPHSAILYHANDCLFERNEVRNVLLETGDAGAFYTGRDPTSRGNVLRFNYVHGLGNSCGAAKNTMAFYLDDCDAGDTVASNRVKNVARGLMLGGGHDNHIIGNTFENCAIGMSIDARGVVWDDRWDSPIDKSWQMTRKVKEMHVEREPWRTKYPLLLTYLEDGPREPRHIDVVGNTFTNCKEPIIWSMRAGEFKHLIHWADNTADGKSFKPFRRFCI